MKKLGFILLTFIILVLAVFIYQSRVCALKMRDIPYWGRYVFTTPRLDIAIGGLKAVSISKSDAILICNNKDPDWLQLREGIGRVNLYNIDWEDLICEFSQDSSINANLREKSGLKYNFRITKADDFLIFSNIGREYIEIDKYDDTLSYTVKLKREGNKWSFFGKLHLKEGEYFVQATSEGDILFIPEKVYRLWYKRVKSYILKNDVFYNYLFKDKKNAYINIFSPDDAVKIRMDVETNLDKLETVNKHIIAKGVELLDWKHYANDITEYTDRIDERGNLNINLLFNGDPKEDEYLRISSESYKIDVDLEENPYLGLRCKVEDPGIQTIQIVLGVDFDNDRKPDEYFVEIHTPNKTKLWTECVYPAYKIIREKYPGRKYMHVVFMEVYPHKRWGADCSGEKKGMYRFWFKDLYFFNKLESDKIFLLDTPIIDDQYWDSWNMSILKGSLDVEKEMKEIRIVERSEIDIYKDVSAVDLREYPLLVFNFSINNEIGLDTLYIVVSLDFDNDGKADSELVIKEEDIMFSPVNLLERAESLFPGKEFYIVLKFNIKFIVREGFQKYGDIQLGKFALFHRDNIGIEDISLEGNYFCLDNKRIKVDKYFKSERLKGLWLEAEANLENGRHMISGIFKNVFLNSSKIVVEKRPEYTYEETMPEIRGFRRLNPTLCKITVKGGGSPFWLVFNEYFHPAWRAYLIQNKDNSDIIDRCLDWSTVLYTSAMRRGLVEITNHRFVNNCANGWWINDLGDKEADILLVFTPQKKYEIALLATGISILGCMLGIWRLRRYH